MKELENVSEERLKQIHTLTRNVQQPQDRVGQPDPVAEERLADILKLNAHIQSVEQALAEVKRAAENARRSSTRYGQAPPIATASCLSLSWAAFCAEYQRTARPAFSACTTYSS